MKRLRDQALAHLRTIGVGGVDEIDPELNRASEHSVRLVGVARLLPDSPTGDTHGPETETVNGDLSTDLQLPGEGRVGPLSAQSYAFLSEGQASRSNVVFPYMPGVGQIDNQVSEELTHDRIG